MNILFATYITDIGWKEHCALPLERSFHYFHPDIPFKIIEGNEVNNLFCKDDVNRNIRFSKPLLGKKLFKDYDRIILMDADQLVTGPLTELIDSQWELAGVRSNDDQGRSRPLGAFCTPKIPWERYLNCGLCGVGKPSAWDKWDYLNRNHNPHMEDAEQGTWNELFYSGEYQTKLLDPVDQNIIYGVAANSAHWNSLYIEDNKIMLNLTGTPKWVKVLHRAGVGGIGAPYNKFEDSRFHPDVAAYLRRIKS